MTVVRLAFLLNNLHGGGAERVAVTVANALAEKGHDISLVLNHRQGPYLTDVSPRVRVCELRKRMLYALPSLFSLLRRARFDAVFTILDQPTIAALLLRPFVGGTRIIVVECNNPLGEEISNNWVWRFVRVLRRWLYPSADHIISKSEGIRRTLIAHFGCRKEQVTTVPNPVDLARIDRLKVEALDHPWLHDRQVPLVVAVGRLEPQKDYVTLLNAFAQLRQSRVARLIVLGEGGERGQLESCARQLGIREDVDMAGFVGNPYAFLASADLYVLSSRWEGWPNALVEALACGTPAVATDCDSGPRDILDGGKFGGLVSVGDAKALASAMMNALDVQHDADRLRLRAAVFTPERAAQAYEDVLRGVTGR